MPEERTLKITCDECGYSEMVLDSRLPYEEGKMCPSCRKGKMWWVPPAEEARRREVRRKAMPEAKISPAVIILPIGLGLGLAAALGIAALARAARPTVFTCPYCGATFATEEELNDHLQTEHPGELPTPWSFSNVKCWHQASGIGIWQESIFSALVTNVGDGTATKTLTLWRRDYRPVWIEPPGYYEWQWTDWSSVESVTVTLAPGQSYQYNQQTQTLLAYETGREQYLADSDGYESAHCTIPKIPAPY